MTVVACTKMNKRRGTHSGAPLACLMQPLLGDFYLLGLAFLVFDGDALAFLQF